MSDFWRGWMYAACLILVVMLFGPIAVNALQWVPEDTPPRLWDEVAAGLLDAAPLLVGVGAALIACNLILKAVYSWMLEHARDADES